ncbi:MAG: hypothetical protein CVV47_03740 [Spirochaetae bacterium HGW-Spirochaetae-3]|jgi:predicted acetyltransferase|nr:MAG: hypothetical protein CVV47_03740 [Spirochaetae bacterium HGW-Spirochaetae-3]
MNGPSLILCTPENSQIIKNLYPLYIYDLAEFEFKKFNDSGILGQSNCMNWDQKTKSLDLWWENTDERFPYIIYDNSEPIGFCLIACPTIPYEGIDNYLVEFFIAKTSRNKGIGRLIARKAIESLAGSWTLRVLPRNNDAYTFWKNTIHGFPVILEYDEYVDSDRMICFDFMIEAKQHADGLNSQERV